MEDIEEYDESQVDTESTEITDDAAETANDEAVTDEYETVEEDTEEVIEEETDEVPAEHTDKKTRRLERMQIEAEAAADFIEGILDEADLDGDIQMGIANKRVLLEVITDGSSRTSRILTGRNNRVLDALQHLTREAVQTSTHSRSDLILDIGNRRQMQEESLKRRVKNAIKTVEKNENIIKFEPMNSYQRKLIHSMAREAGVYTVSKGQAPNRYVVLSKYEIVE